VPEGAKVFIPTVQKMENGLILDRVDDDLSEKFIWQQQHQAHHGHQGEGEEIAQRQGLEIERRRGLKLAATRVEVGDKR
jgi:predicted metal-dependent hydrolase